jgi:AraC-like DNA-binding protein
MRERRGTRMVPVLLVDAVWARRVVAELDRAGLPAADLLRAVGLCRDQLTEPDAHIPFNAHAMLLENAARALRDPCFGFRLGSAVELTEAGLLAYITLNSHDLGGALRNMCRYLAILTEGAVFELQREAGEVRLLITLLDPVGMASRQLPEFSATLMVRICDAITDHRARPVRIELRHDLGCPTLPRQLGLPVIVSQEQFALVFDGASLAAPIIRADARLLDLLQRYADDLLAERAHRDDLVARANRWIIQNLHTGQVDVLQLASGLGMSNRTLARRLAEEGFTPARLVKRLRQQVARNYLADRAIPLGRITYLLGYSDLSAFTRAFRRWTGRTPSEWRVELSHSPPPSAAPASKQGGTR